MTTTTTTPKTTPKTIAFNTKRLYTAHGQRIVASLHDDGVVTFHDIDRMICGEFALLGELFNRDTVMRAYDNNSYQATSRSHRDAFYNDSCNARDAFTVATAGIVPTKCGAFSLLNHSDVAHAVPRGYTGLVHADHGALRYAACIDGQWLASANHKISWFKTAENAAKALRKFV